MTLSKIKIYSVCQKWASDNRHYIFANDKDLVNNFINLSKEKFIGEAEVAMLVGNSYLFSLAHHILIKGYQTVYICDIDPSVLRFIKYVYHIIKYVSDYEEFVYSIKSGIQKEYSDFSTAAIEKYFNIELKTIGDKHFLFSQNNFDLAKLALAELDIHLVQINLSSKSSITSFSAHLRLKKTENCIC